MCATAITFLWIVSGDAAADPPLTSVPQPAAESADAELGTVTVEAQREALKRQLSTFVSAIALHSRNDSLARWQVSICPLVAGLPADKGVFVLERVSQVASEAGIPLASEGCAPNLLVVMTRDAEAFLRSWWDQEPRLFNKDRGVGGIKRTIRTQAPVRVFYNACSAALGTAKTFALQGGPSCDTGTPGSRLTWSAVRVIYSVIVVVDLGQVKALQLGPLTDYIAMIALAHIRRSPELGAAPTILRLFDETDLARPQALSAWDQAFLKSLYGTDSGNVTQLSQITFRMVEDVAR